MPDRRALQERIDAALRTTPDDFTRSTFSELTDSAADLVLRLYQRAAGEKGPELAVDSALDEFSRIEKADRLRAQHALIQFVTHHPEAVKLGLRVPDLEERSPWMVRGFRNTE